MRRLAVVSAESLRSWYPAFAGPDDRVIYQGFDPESPTIDAENLILEAGGRVVEFLSSHETLRRDQRLAGQLRSAGIDARCQSALALTAADDKVMVKELLEDSGISTPPWGRGSPPQPSTSPALRKRRSGTQSQGLAWARATDHLGEDCYWEKYIDGIEFSVVLHREDRRTIVFPPVWKGATQRNLQPPWRRLRVCPLPLSERHLTGALSGIGLRAAELLDVWGFAEVELIASGGSLSVIEVNPRVSGTLRLVAMATDTRVFDHAELAARPSRLRATRFAAELPYDGEPFMTENVIATSRITCAATTPNLVRRLMAEHVSAPALWPDEWADD